MTFFSTMPHANSHFFHDNQILVLWINKWRQNKAFTHSLRERKDRKCSIISRKFSLLVHQTYHIPTSWWSTQHISTGPLIGDLNIFQNDMLVINTNHHNEEQTTTWMEDFLWHKDTVSNMAKLTYELPFSYHLYMP